MEFACELTSSSPPARVEGRVWAALLGKDPPNLPNPANPANPPSVPECVFWSNTLTLFADFVKSDTPVQCFLIVSWTSQLKHLLLRGVLASNLPKKTLNSRCLGGEVQEKVKKHCTGVSLFTKSAKKVGVLLQNTHSGTLTGLARSAGHDVEHNTHKK